MKIAFLIVLAVIASGCSTINYKGLGGESVTYTRVGSQNLSGVAIKKTADGIELTLNSQRTSTQEITDALTKVAGMAINPVNAVK